MTSFLKMEESDMSLNPGKTEQQFTDVESYRKLVLLQISLRRYKSALYWAEKVAVLSHNNPKDVYQLAQCMFMLKEYNRAAHVIKSSQLEKSNLLCLTLLVESLFASKDFHDALELLNSLDIEDLNASLQNDTEMESSQMSIDVEPNKNVSLHNNI
jgi:anaphase-promoting complex subunit 6